MIAAALKVERAGGYDLIPFETFCAVLIPRFEKAKNGQKVTGSAGVVRQMVVAYRLSWLGRFRTVEG